MKLMKIHQLNKKIKTEVVAIKIERSQSLDALRENSLRLSYTMMEVKSLDQMEYDKITF